MCCAVLCCAVCALLCCAVLVSLPCSVDKKSGSVNPWAAWYNTWLLIEIDAKRRSLFFSFFSFWVGFLGWQSEGLSAGRVAGYTAAQVEEVRMVMRMLPIFFTTILFWTIYCQVSTPTCDL